MKIFRKKSGFTLAETLITLTVLGVVAAIVIPQFAGNYKANAFQKSHAIFNAPHKSPFYEALRQMSTQDDIMGYSTTVEFVDKFEDYMKVLKRCDGNSAGGNGVAYSKCFISPLTSTDPSDSAIDLDSLSTTQEAFSGSSFDSDLVALRLNNGYSMVLGYDPTCNIDPISNTQSPWSCVSFVYDINGNALPNKHGDTKDINGNVTFKFKDANFPNCIPSGLCYGMPAGMSEGASSIRYNSVPFAITSYYNATYAGGWYGSYGCTGSSGNWTCPDTWQSGKNYCTSIGGHMASINEYSEIFDYGVSQGTLDTNSASTVTNWAPSEEFNSSSYKVVCVGTYSGCYPAHPSTGSGSAKYSVAPFYCVKD